MSPRRKDEQPALGLEIPATGDERVAREEIGRFYEDRVSAARVAYEKAAAELADAERLRDAWSEGGEIVSVYKASPLSLTVMGIVADSQGRYMDAAKAVLRPVLDAPTTTAARSELDRLDSRAETPALRETTEDMAGRYKALCRWLVAQGHDLGHLDLSDETGSRTRPRRR